MQALSITAVVLLGYLAGSIPFGYLLVRAFRGIDIRDYGSHNIGMSHGARGAGWGPAGAFLPPGVRGAAGGRRLGRRRDGRGGLSGTRLLCLLPAEGAPVLAG